MAKRLTREGFERARRFMAEQARPLDRALFAHRFEGAPAAGVVDELARFQNDDGGFGRALEPDMRTPGSSALATSIALDTLREMGVGAGHPLVQAGVGYLLDSFDGQSHTWRVVPPDANDHPHAPWWHDEDGSLARTFDGFLVVPRARIVALLHHFSDQVPRSWLTELAERTVADVENLERLGTGGGDDLASAAALAEAPGLPEPARLRLLARLRAVLPIVVSRDPAEWVNYSLQPLKVAPSPDSPLADLMGEDLRANLDYQVDRQAPDGAWDPNWSWFGFYPQVWEQACKEWRGHLTLETLTSLRAFGRIEG